MGNSFTAKVEESETVILKLTSGKSLTLTNVLHVPKIRKNLVSIGLLSKYGFKLVFESDQIIVTKGGVFVGKGYVVNDMLRININN